MPSSVLDEARSPSIRWLREDNRRAHATRDTRHALDHDCAPAAHRSIDPANSNPPNETRTSAPHPAPFLGNEANPTLRGIAQTILRRRRNAAPNR
ncbi:hypothetical protein WI23_27590 [Burkholderia oklahomensis C6786]|nr:hypothetical protein WI23_27590 [Burkholderia oklahomensis C6786]KUY62202.1 hypothetical protein WI23_09015 [Burkholderia oklahomensis C6786]